MKLQREKNGLRYIYQKNFQEVKSEMFNNTLFNEPSNKELWQIIDTGNRCISSELNSINSRINSALKPSAPKLTGHAIISDKGMLCFVRQYDNEVGKTCPLFIRNVGSYNISRLHFTEYNETPELFSIEFPDINDCIIGEIKRLRGAYLYELFIQRGFVFHPSVVQSKLPCALHTFFTPQILNTENISEFPALAGFNLGTRFFYDELMPKTEALSKLPISGKHFEKLPMEQNTFKLYKRKLLMFGTISERFLVAVYPFLSIMSSHFESEGRNFNLSLNFVPIDGFDAKKICQLFQIFNRNVLTPVNAEITPKSLEKHLRTVKDETIILDCRSGGDSDYAKERLRENNLQRIRAVLSGQKALPDQRRNKICAGLVTISDNLIFRADVRNILLDSGMLENLDTSDFNIDYFAEEKVMERILSEFVNYIEIFPQEELWMIFLKKRDYTEETSIVLAIIDEILTKFWAQYNLDFHSELDFPKDIDFHGIYKLLRETENDDDELFIDFLFDIAPNYQIVRKDSQYASSDTIFYSREFIWFPVSLLKKMCQENGLKNTRKLLLKLRAKKQLITDVDSLSRRVQVNRQSFEAYQFTRQTFNRPGGIDITEIGKEMIEWY